ncbi:MAG: hypothetical protein H6R01_534 [Burkholderiaceae bacterium]|nr:hypothetical protein [Burkholderiaceae bacterium]
MGGTGSGRGYRFGKDTTDDYLYLDVRWLQRSGLLELGKDSTLTWRRNGEPTGNINIISEGHHLRLIYKHRRPGREWQDEDYSIRLEWTPCHFGGLRAWFICPANGCGKRIAILYGGAIFLCRHCHRLAYSCQRERGYDRLARKADKIRDRLGWEAGILNGRGTKPKGMHRRTYLRLRWQHDGLVQASLAGIALNFGMDLDYSRV